MAGTHIQTSLDAHARPPDSMRVLYKKWQKSSIEEINNSDDLLDFSHLAGGHLLRVHQSTKISSIQLSQTFQEFLRQTTSCEGEFQHEEVSGYELNDLPGLFVYPSLLPHSVQVALMDRIMHRDLSNPSHQTNLHLHYSVTYPQQDTDDERIEYKRSFFLADQRTTLYPKDSAVHESLTVKQMLDRKLRWMTLGGQYDWTAKAYPPKTPPAFPEDISRLLQGLFADVDAQAAITNFYTPGDTLSVHRDVSEECDRGLISISIGCDGIFILGDKDGSRCASIRLRSGDVVLMSGESRYAWHAVPKIIPDTCPELLRHWPANDLDATFQNWKGWLASKRINLNVRQMHL